MTIQTSHGILDNPLGQPRRLLFFGIPIDINRLFRSTRIGLMYYLNDSHIVRTNLPTDSVDIRVTFQHLLASVSPRPHPHYLQWPKNYQGSLSASNSSTPWSNDSQIMFLWYRQKRPLEPSVMVPTNLEVCHERRENNFVK